MGLCPSCDSEELVLVDGEIDDAGISHFYYECPACGFEAEEVWEGDEE